MSENSPFFFMKEFSNEELAHLLVNKVRELKESKSEVDELNNRLQDMVARLEDTQQELVSQKEHLQEEVKLKTEELMKAEKLATIGELSARIAHDLRNPLSVIKNTTGVLQHNLKETLDVQSQEQFRRLDRAIYRMQHQLEDVLDYIRKSPLRKIRMNTDAIIHDAIDRISVPNNIIINIPKNDTEIFCDPNRLEVVFVNLIMNAIQAIEGRPGSIDVIVEEDNSDARFAIIKIKDSGSGIPDELCPEIFDPLFTTRQIGTGLGLPSCKNIVEQHGGSITFDTTLGVGTIFSIKIPKDYEWENIKKNNLEEFFKEPEILANES